MGGYLHPAHKQCSKSHSLHSDHTALQGDPAAGLDQLQAAEAIAQQPPSPSSFLYLAGNVASSWKPECSVSRVPGTSFWDVLYLKDKRNRAWDVTEGQAKWDMRCYTGTMLSLGPTPGQTHLFVCLLTHTSMIILSYYQVTKQYPSIHLLWKCVTRSCGWSVKWHGAFLSFMQHHVRCVQSIGSMVSQVLLSQYNTCLHLPPVNFNVKQAWQELQKNGREHYKHHSAPVLVAILLFINSVQNMPCVLNRGNCVLNIANSVMNMTN